MTPDEIKTLRKELACTAKELAGALGTDQATVLAWEKADLFPTKALVERMNDLRTRGPSAIVRKAKGAAEPMKVLTDPQVWSVVRKLLAHKALRDQVMRLAETFPDPAGD